MRKSGKPTSRNWRYQEQKSFFCLVMLTLYLCTFVPFLFIIAALCRAVLQSDWFKPGWGDWLEWMGNFVDSLTKDTSKVSHSEVFFRFCFYLSHQLDQFIFPKGVQLYSHSDSKFWTANGNRSWTLNCWKGHLVQIRRNKTETNGPGVLELRCPLAKLQVQSWIKTRFLYLRVWARFSPQNSRQRNFGKTKSGDGTENDWHDWRKAWPRSVWDRPRSVWDRPVETFCGVMWFLRGWAGASYNSSQNKFLMIFSVGCIWYHGQGWKWNHFTTRVPVCILVLPVFLWTKWSWTQLLGPYRSSWWVKQEN